MQLWKLHRKRRGQKKEGWWVRLINRLKNQQGYRENFVREIETQDHEDFFHNF